MKNNKVLVLGANGFIGSHVVDSLIDAGYAVRAFDNFRAKDTRFNMSDGIEIFSGDFLNTADIRAALDDVNYVFHLISTTTPATAEANPLIDIETNIKGSVSLFQACVDTKTVKKVIYPSSGGTVYGDRNSKTPIHEDEPTLPISPYGIGKLTVENYLRYFKKKFGLRSTIFRIANPYGERQPRFRKQGVIPIFMERIMQEEPISVLGDGSMVRDYIYVKDVANMMVATLAANPQYEIYNLGSGKGYSIHEIIHEIEDATGKRAVIEKHDTPSTFVHTSVLSTERYYQEFGAFDATNLNNGIKLTYEYYQSELGIVS